MTRLIVPSAARVVRLRGGLKSGQFRRKCNCLLGGFGVLEGITMFGFAFVLLFSNITKSNTKKGRLLPFAKCFDFFALTPSKLFY